MARNRYTAARVRLMTVVSARLVVASLLACAVLLVTAGHNPIWAQVTASASPTTGDDWPTYLHDPQRSAASNESILSPANVSQLTRSWSFKTGGVVAASPSIAGGTVYVGSWDGYEYALDASTGALKWKTYLGVTSGPGCNPPAAGISSAATVQNGVVYVGGGDAYWYALDTATGSVLWKVYTGDNSATSGHYNWSSPLIYNGYAYIGVASLGDCPLVQGQLLQVSLTTHLVTNTFNVVPAGQVGGGIWTAPSVDAATNTIYVTTGTENSTSQSYAQAILALDASTLAVKASWKLPEAQAVLDSDFGTTPTLFADATGRKLVAAINKNGAAYAYDRTNLGAGPVWQQQIAIGGECPTCGEGSVSSGAVGNGALFLAGGNGTINGVGYGGTIRALNPATGAFLWQQGASGSVFGALAYVNGLVIDGAGQMLEVRDATTGARLFTYQTGGTLYAAPSVSNGQIFTGGVDGSVYAFGLPSTLPPTPPPDANCPAGWTCQDIGAPAPAGSESVSGATWNVAAGGTGVGGSSDQFRFIAQNASGDTQATAQLVSQQAVNTTSQAGLMVRQSTDPTAPYYAVFVTPNNGLAVQYRATFGGVTTVANRLTTGPLPQYLELQRTGDQVQAATSTDGAAYTLIPGSTVSLVMPATVIEGVAVSSDSSGVAGTAAFTAVALGSPSTTPSPAPSPSPCPSGWTCADVGNPILVGDAALSAGVWTVKGAGGDIWGTGDQFHYVWQTLAADGSVSAHVTSQTNTDPWAKAGVMLRQSANTNAAYYAAFVTPGNGIVVQYRTIQGLAAAQVSSLAGTVPSYLEVARSGTTYTAYSSADGKTWTAIAGSSIGVAGLTGTVLVGMAVTAHNAGALSTATMDTVTLSTTAPAPPGSCPGGWTCADIGYTAPAGGQSLSNGVWTLQGAGGDIWGTGDQFHYVWQTLAADGSVSAHVTSQTNTSPWAKAGVMLRLSSDPGAPFYAVFVTPGNGISVQYRATPGGSAAQAVNVAGSVPAYLEVVRSGTAYTAYTSADGSTWTPVGGSSVTLPGLTGTLLVGMAVTAHNSGTLSTATMDTVTLSTTAPPPPGACPSGWTCADVGSPALAGGQTLSNGVWTLQGAGGDIWGTGDQFHYVWQTLAADGSVSAHVTSQTNTSPWAKAGVMLRLSSDPGAPFYAVFVTPGNGISVQYRATPGGSAAQAVNVAGSVPAYLEIARSGTTYTAYTSSNGTAWTVIAGSSIGVAGLTGTVLVGMAVTAHNAAALSTATMDTVTLSTTAPPPPGACPSGWACADIGYTAPAGGQSLNNGVWTLQGAGGDIWGTGDQFHYVWQTLAADGSISAHVTSQTNTSPWAKAGVMLRLSSDPGAPFYAVFVTPGNGISVQYRATLGGSAAQAVDVAGSVPAYLRVVRVGTTYTAYTSADGVTWSAIAGSAQSLGGLTGALLAGMAVTAHNTGALSTATMDSAGVSTAAAIAKPLATAPAVATAAPTVTTAIQPLQSLGPAVIPSPTVTRRRTA